MESISAVLGSQERVIISKRQIVERSVIGWGFFRRRSAILCEGDQQYCDSDQESERSDAGSGIVSEVIEMVKEKKSSLLSRG